jgi:hypothetical protein
LPVGTYFAIVYTNSFQRRLIENINVVSYRPTKFDLKLTPLGPNQLPNDTDIPLENIPALYPIAAIPLFRDPIHDGAADPVVIWNRARKRWWMLYTNRRADLADNNGVTWVHGTRIGIAESSDGGAYWQYVSEADIPVPSPDYTLWAPEIIDTGGTYHMFLTVVPGTFTDWNHPRHILHLTSNDLVHWKPLANANLESDRTIDACIFRLPSGLWRLWYKNEADSSKVYFSDSPDLVHWTPKGIATTNHGEGPVVFQWRGFYWLINDPHAGLAVFRSSDLTTWLQQPKNLLSEPGTQPTDRAMGNHADVVVDGSGHAWLFYFTQQSGADAQGHDPGWARRSVLHVTELHEANGILTVDRNAPATISMIPPPINKKSDMAGAWTVAAAGDATLSGPIRVSSGTIASLAISQPQPIYPPITKDDHVAGTIILHALISKQGDIEDLSVISRFAQDRLGYIGRGEDVEVQAVLATRFASGGRNDYHPQRKLCRQLVDHPYRTPSHKLFHAVDKQPVRRYAHVVRLQHGAELARLFQVQQHLARPRCSHKNSLQFFQQRGVIIAQRNLNPQ